MGPVSRGTRPSRCRLQRVVINLAGAPIAHWPWTSGYKRKILESRLATGRTIATAIAELDQRPAWVNASGIGYYGDRGDEVLDEGSTNGAGFLAEVVRQWEASTEPARSAGARVCMIRTAVVLDSDGGALKLMKLPFQLGIGGRIGDGRQWFPTVSLTDYLAAVTRMATDASLEGPFNMTAPGACDQCRLHRGARASARPADLHAACRASRSEPSPAKCPVRCWAVSGPPRAASMRSASSSPIPPSRRSSPQRSGSQQHVAQRSLTDRLDAPAPVGAAQPQGVTGRPVARQSSHHIVASAHLDRRQPIHHRQLDPISSVVPRPDDPIEAHLGSIDRDASTQVRPQGLPITLENGAAGQEDLIELIGSSVLPGKRSSAAELPSGCSPSRSRQVRVTWPAAYQAGRRWTPGVPPQSSSPRHHRARRSLRAPTRPRRCDVPTAPGRSGRESRDVSRWVSYPWTPLSPKSADSSATHPQARQQASVLGTIQLSSRDESMTAPIESRKEVSR